MSSEDKEREIEITEIMRILGTEEGRKFIMRILTVSKLNIDTFDPDTHIHAHNAGKRSVGLWLSRELQDAAPELYNLMIQEHQENG